MERSAALRRALAPLGPYLSDIVLIGGCVPWLYLEERAVRTSLTIEADVLLPQTSRRGEEIAEELNRRQGQLSGEVETTAGGCWRWWSGRAMSWHLSYRMRRSCSVSAGSREPCGGYWSGKGPRRTRSFGTRPDRYTCPQEESMTIEELEAAALKLPPAERERLGEKLLSSVDTPLVFEDEWAEEADRRVEEIRSGSVKPVSGQDVLRAALDRLK